MKREEEGWGISCWNFMGRQQRWRGHRQSQTASFSMYLTSWHCTAFVTERVQNLLPYRRQSVRVFVMYQQLLYTHVPTKIVCVAREVYHGLHRYGINNITHCINFILQYCVTYCVRLPDVSDMTIFCTILRTFYFHAARKKNWNRPIVIQHFLMHICMPWESHNP
jgi:hypothetical protein